MLLRSLFAGDGRRDRAGDRRRRRNFRRTEARRISGRSRRRGRLLLLIDGLLELGRAYSTAPRDRSTIQTEYNILFCAQRPVS